MKTSGDFKDSRKKKVKAGKKSGPLVASDEPNKMKKSEKETEPCEIDFVQSKPQKIVGKKKKMVKDKSELILPSDKPPTRKRKKNDSASRETEKDEDVSEHFLPLDESPTRKHEESDSELSETEIVRIKPKKLRREKKEVVAQLAKLQEIMKTNVPPDEEELELEKLVFGGTIEDLEEQPEETVETKDLEKPELISAWEDEDDEDTLVKEKAETWRNCHRSVSLRGEEKFANFAQEKFIKLMGAPKWADLNKKDEKMSDDESEDELLQKTGNVIVKSESLPKGNINVSKCPTLLDSSTEKSLIKSVKFHPSYRSAMVASTSGHVNLFQVDGKVNSKIQSIYFKDFPIYDAHFSADGSQIFVGSNKYAHFYSYDMLSGKTSKIPWQRGMEQTNFGKFQLSPDGRFIVVHGRFGNIHLMAYKSREWIGSLKMNGEVNAIAFNQDGSKMYSHGENREVYIWDMAARRCIHKFEDKGCVIGTALSVSPNEQFLATGADSGYVNIYDSKSVLFTSSPEPLKEVQNLITRITSLKFNCTSELLCMASCHQAEAVKLVHFPSMTVFSNFPSSGERKVLRYPNSLDISTNSGYLCIGNNAGAAHMYRLKHFKNY